LAAGVLVTASAATVPSLLKSADTNDVVAPTVKNDANTSLIRESQLRQAPATAPATSSPQRVETIKYDSWVVVCQDAAAGTAKKTCSATLRVAAQNQNRRQLLLEWQIGLNMEGHFVTAFHVPPIVATKSGDKMVGGPLLIQNGMELKFGNGAARRINYVWCGPKQCLAEALIDDAFIKEALANTNATVTVYTAGRQAVPIEISIKGIDKAISSTRK